LQRLRRLVVACRVAYCYRALDSWTRDVAVRLVRFVASGSALSSREQAQPSQGDHVKIPIQVEPAAGVAPVVEYRWDPDTEILSAQLNPRGSASGLSGSVEVEGSDGSWLILDVSSGRINGVEVAVWPDVRTRNALKPPAAVEDARISVPARRSQSGLAAVEVETPVMAETDESERVFHFTLGRPRQTRTVRFASDLLVDVDSSNHLAGLWLLNVPPFPARV
jgi:hypothetical protein